MNCPYSSTGTELIRRTTLGEVDCVRARCGRDTLVAPRWLARADVKLRTPFWHRKRIDDEPVCKAVFRSATETSHFAKDRQVSPLFRYWRQNNFIPLVQPFSNFCFTVVHQSDLD